MAPSCLSGSECKRGMDFTYDGQYGFHPLLISLANTGEPLFLFNRSGNRPRKSWPMLHLDRAVTLCRQAGFRKILLRGDTKFAQTRHLDRWDDAGDIRSSSSDTRHTIPSRREAGRASGRGLQHSETTATAPDQNHSPREARAG